MTTTTDRFTLARNADGEPMDPPPEANAWRVRRRSGRQGRPQGVFDHETGAPLEIPLDATIDDLRDYGPGVYRLDAIDGEGKLIAGVTALTEVPIDTGRARTDEDPSETVATLREMVQLVRGAMETNCRAMEAMAAAFGPLRPAGGQPIVMEARGVGGEAKADAMEQILAAILQAAPHILRMYGGGAVAAAQGDASGAAPATAGVAA